MLMWWSLLHPRMLLCIPLWASCVCQAQGLLLLRLTGDDTSNNGTCIIKTHSEIVWQSNGQQLLCGGTVALHAVMVMDSVDSIFVGASHHARVVGVAFREKIHWKRNRAPPVCCTGKSSTTSHGRHENKTNTCTATPTHLCLASRQWRQHGAHLRKT